MKKPLKVAAYSGLFLFIFTFLIGIISNIIRMTGGIKALTLISIFNLLILTALGVFFVYGFVVLGKRFNAKLLVVMSWISIAFSILLLIISLVSNLSSMISDVSAQSEIIITKVGNDSTQDNTLPVTALPDISEPVEKNLFGNLVGFLIKAYFIISLIFGLYSILFGIGLLKLKDKVKYGKTSAILNIVSGATYILFIGWIIQFIAIIYEIKMFFHASKEFENGLEI